ncbi:MAG TPA: OmpW family protein [Bosea sp. (in: a-proteobacteria)]|jgi:outer membrane protein|uniref:OmpW/AlkL family protein n=1 Tax=Bosea sp. (in: a-proteobacteria) TaxID=1871050 RepID=UPI002E0E7492|nr:OmpW family protein [Bosea sp. (in: a-proteobacteria)]
MSRTIHLSACATLLAATALTAPFASVHAADLPSAKAAPIAPIMTQWSPWMIRGRALVVVPQEEARLKLGGAPIVGGDVNISNSVVPELDISYFFTKNIAVELILGVTPHNVKGAGALAGARIGSAWLLPPTLMLQYHFTDLGAFKPYVGVGVNYTVFFNEKAKGGFTSFDLKDSFGVALQAGFDYMIDKNWGINFDVKKIFLEPKVKVNNGLVSGKVKIDPWLIGTGITYRF